MIGSPRVGTYGLKIRARKDPQAFAIGRITQLPDGDSAVIICQLTGPSQWGAQRLSNGELCCITIPNRKRSDFPIIGHYATEATLW